MTSRPKGKRGKGFCDDIIEVFLIKGVIIGEGCQTIMSRHLWTTPYPKLVIVCKQSEIFWRSLINRCVVNFSLVSQNTRYILNSLKIIQNGALIIVHSSDSKVQSLFQFKQGEIFSKNVFFGGLLKRLKNKPNLACLEVHSMLIFKFLFALQYFLSCFKRRDFCHQINKNK